jgi:dephospho-CoA kinase
MMLRFGLTGGIGSGKSTVSTMLRERGVPVLDADVLAHQLLEPGQEAYEEAVRDFGKQILRPDGTIDRAKLGALVFADAIKRARLNRMMHPRIRAIAEKWFVSLEQAGGFNFALEDAALIIEAGARKNFDRIVVCWCRPEQQLERLLARGLSSEDAERRIAAQMPIDEKRRLADDVIDCSGAVEETRRQVDQMIEKWKQMAADAENIS